jgi:hypothetical protein
MWDSNPGPILWVLYNALPLDKKELGDCDVFLGCLDDFERHIGAYFGGSCKAKAWSHCEGAMNLLKFYLHDV